jgi:peptide subunit release factor 1 (eRF1)
MIARDEIRELANFHSPETCALTFYYQPSTPQDLSHRGESILVKDMLRNAIREAEKGGKNGCAKADLERVSAIVEALRGNGGKAKAVFACAGQNFWREYDLPPQLPKTQVILNQRFHLKPLAALMREGRKTLVVLADRTKARVFELSDDKINELQDFFNDLSRHGKSDGFAGYDGGHAERRVSNETAQHFKVIADYLKDRYEREPFDQLLIGCHDEQWPEIEGHLHTDAKKKLIGHFRVDPKAATPEQVKEMAVQHITQHDGDEKQRLIGEVIGEAHRNGNGAIGLRRVLRSLEVGEVQTLLLGSNFQASGVKCYHCGHMDLHDAKDCAVCGKPNTQLEDIGDAIVGHALRGNIETLWIDNNEEFDRIGRIAALLRFRADQNTPLKVAV